MPTPAAKARTIATLGWIVLALLLPVPWILARYGGAAEDMGPGMVSMWSGLAIVGAAFLLSWGAELAERDISQNLALVVLALLAILPEYAVDLTFAWIAGTDPEYVQYTVANMTGANRLLIGLGWPLIVLLYGLKFRRREIHLDQRQGLEIAFLLMATMYSFLLPLKGSIALYDSAILFALFGLYVYTASQAQKQETHFAGPAGSLDRLLGNTARRGWVLASFAYAAFAIWIAAHPFADGLVETGKRYGVPPFLLVQWLAPIASESPEAVVAILFAIRAKPSTAMGALSSSVVNQWTLLVGAIPLVYSISRGEASAMPLVPRTSEELLLTSAQSLFAVALLANFRIDIREAGVLLVLFLVTTFFPSTEVRVFFAFAYIAMAVVLLLARGDRRRQLQSLLLSRGRSSGLQPRPRDVPSSVVPADRG
ncbi:MAG: sodium:calcium antiporter [Gemmatimonadetes bacterium]|nr:sodium:calcium antiporter [Gemmatimonadota bacterium]